MNTLLPKGLSTIHQTHSTTYSNTPRYSKTSSNFRFFNLSTNKNNNTNNNNISQGNKIKMMNNSPIITQPNVTLLPSHQKKGLNGNSNIPNTNGNTKLLHTVPQRDSNAINLEG